MGDGSFIVGAGCHESTRLGAYGESDVQEDDTTLIVGRE
jgi:hypothetical protein